MHTWHTFTHQCARTTTFLSGSLSRGDWENGANVSVWVSTSCLDHLVCSFFASPAVPSATFHERLHPQTSGAVQGDETVKTNVRSWGSVIFINSASCKLSWSPSAAFCPFWLHTLICLNSTELIQPWPPGRVMHPLPISSTKWVGSWAKSDSYPPLSQGGWGWATPFCRPHFVDRPSSYNSVSFYRALLLRSNRELLIRKFPSCHFVKWKWDSFAASEHTCGRSFGLPNCKASHTWDQQLAIFTDVKCARSLSKVRTPNNKTCLSQPNLHKNVNRGQVFRAILMTSYDHFQKSARWVWVEAHALRTNDTNDTRFPDMEVLRPICRV